jgi:cytochrome d ubiquinol oxidase subunit I
VWLHWQFLRTGDNAFMLLFRFWLKLFALGFGVGVVSGIVLSFEFGTNFAGFSRATANVLAPLLSYEVLTAFFLEASFLPVLLFGWGRVGPRLHFFATLMVCAGTVLSAFWILAANSWMQTPAGHLLRDGVFYPLDWWQVIFNPSFPWRFFHMVVASLVSGCFAIAGVSAIYLLRDRHPLLARKSLSIALWSALAVVPLQVALGDLHGRNTLEHQPMKVAAMEGLWQTQKGPPFLLFAMPDQEGAANHHAFGIPHVGGLILRHAWDGEVAGLDQVPPRDRPQVAVVFWAFRLMLGIGFLLLGVALAALVLRAQGRLYDRRGFLHLLVFCSPLGFIAVVAGWVVTEAGRQPWVVQGMLRTADAATPLPAASVGGSLLMFTAIYLFLLISFIWFVLRIVRHGPEEQIPAERVPGVPLTAWYPHTQEEKK